MLNSEPRIVWGIIASNSAYYTLLNLQSTKITFQAQTIMNAMMSAINIQRCRITVELKYQLRIWRFASTDFTTSSIFHYKKSIVVGTTYILVLFQLPNKLIYVHHIHVENPTSNAQLTGW